jgi:hypothetical protein
MRWRGSRCPSLGCFALDAERELNGEDSNDMFRILLPPLRIQPPLIYRGRSGTWRFGGAEPMVYMCQSLEGSCNGVVWTMAMSWSQRSSRRHPAALF